MENVEKIFNDDIRNKKRTGVGIHKRKGKRGYVGRMVTTVDLLKGEEKKAYKQAGELKQMNVYDKLITLDELNTFDKEIQQQIILNWRKKYSVSEISKGLRASKYYYYEKLYELGIHEKKGGAKLKSIKNYIPRKKPRENLQANDSNIMTKAMFESYSKTNQFYLLDYLFFKYTTDSIAFMWGIKPNTVHQMRYSLKKHMEEKGGLDEYYKSNKIPSVVIEFRESIGDYLTDIEREANGLPKKEKAIAIEPKEKIQEFEDKTLLDVANEPPQQVAEESIKNGRVEESEESESINKSNQDEFELKKDLYKKENEERYQMLQDKLRELSEKLESKSDKEKPLKNIKPFVQNPNAKNESMFMSMNEEKEGFILYQELSHVLKIIEKNPSVFKLDLKIYKIDEK